MPLKGLPPALFAIAWLLATLLVVDAVRRADWNASRRERMLWASATAALVLARQMTVTMPGGLTLQYLGAAWLALLLGYPRAVVSMALVTIVDALQLGRPPVAQGLWLLLLGIGPAWLMWLIVRGCRRWLPANLFVFLLGVGFLGLFVAYAVPLLAAASVGAMAIAGDVQAPSSAAPTASTVTTYWRLVLPYALLLAAGEAWLEGMLTTLLVVFAPGTVRLFDEAHYLTRR